jgi:hypothetical protein
MINDYKKNFRHSRLVDKEEAGERKPFYNLAPPVREFTQEEKDELVKNFKTVPDCHQRKDCCRSCVREAECLARCPCHRP